MTGLNHHKYSLPNKTFPLKAQKATIVTEGVGAQIFYRKNTRGGQEKQWNRVGNGEKKRERERDCVCMC